MENYINFEDIKAQWMKDKEFKEAYDNLEVEYEIALELMKTRVLLGLTQEDIALRMGTTQSVIARLESGKTLPSVKTLANFAKATGKHLHLSFT